MKNWKYILLLGVMAVSLLAVGCGNNEKDVFDTSKDASEIGELFQGGEESTIEETTTEEITTQKETLPPMNYEKCDNLKSVVNMMVIYDLSYNNLPKEPNDKFWQKFTNALICNSWYQGFEDLVNQYGTVWSNTQVEDAAEQLTGQRLKCSSFPDGLDLQNSSSPYAFEWQQKNIVEKQLDDKSYQITFDFEWTSVSTDTNKGIKKVKLIVVPNENSPFDGYSISSIGINEVSYPS